MSLISYEDWEFIYSRMPMSSMPADLWKKIRRDEQLTAEEEKIILQAVEKRKGELGATGR